MAMTPVYMAQFSTSLSYIERTQWGSISNRVTYMLISINLSMDWLLEEQR
jgi:hypothetical protein